MAALFQSGLLGLVPDGATEVQLNPTDAANLGQVNVIAGQKKDYYSGPNWLKTDFRKKLSSTARCEVQNA